MNPENEVGSIWQVMLSKDEEEKLIALLNRHRLPPDKTGLKIFLLSKIDKKDTTGLDLSPEMTSLIEKGMGYLGKQIKKRAGF